MSAQPQWESVDNYTSDLLALVAAGSPSLPIAEEEWTVYVAALKSCRDSDGVISMNRVRPLVRGKVAPRRISAFASAAIAAELVEYTGLYEISDDVVGRNSGKPIRTLRWIGSDS